MAHLKLVAKAITGAITGGLAAIAAYNVEVDPIVLVIAAMIVAGLAVFIVPNSDSE